MLKINQKYINTVVKKALSEDLYPKGDLTTNLLLSKNKVIKAKIIETPARVKATGKPKSKKIQTKAKRISGRKSIMFENQLNQL